MAKRQRGPRSTESIDERRKKKNKRKRPDKKAPKRNLEYTLRKNETKRKNRSEKKMNEVNSKANERKRIKEAMAQKRMDPQYKAKEKEKDRDRKRKRIFSIESIIDDYFRAIKEGPINVCTSCNGRFFRKSTKSLPINTFQSLFTSLEQHISTESVLFCLTCSKSIKSKQIPKLCTIDGLELPEIHPFLRNLSQLEERLVSPVLPFMQVRALGIADKQFGLRGQVVNVPIDVPETVNLLPRRFNSSDTIQIKLKRMIRWKYDYLYEYIHPLKVFQASKYLAEQPLFKDNNITLDHDLMERMQRMEPKVKFVVKPEDNDLFETTETENDREILNPRNNESDGEESDEDDDPKPGESETMIQENGIIIAPGENRRPISFYSENCEFFAFPTLYGGKTFNANNPKKLSVTELAKYKLRYKDRRFAEHPTTIFWLLRQKQIETLRKSINTCLKKTSSQQKTLTAGDILDNNALSSLIRNDQAYQILAGDRTSPVYWEKKMKDLMAMIRQLGVPTFFFTLSAAESKWGELLVILNKISTGKDITEEEALNLSSKDRYNLIRRDPVTCAQYFDHRFRSLFKLLKHQSGPFSPFKVIDYFVRVEFQHRGSPHVHCLLWLDGAPKLDKDSNCVIEDFVDRFITSSDQSFVVKDKELIKLQTHRHTTTCVRKLRNNAQICRFNVPFYPMKRTLILEPLEECESDSESIDSNFSKETTDYIDYKLLHKEIRRKLEEIELSVRTKGENLQNYSFEQLLCDLSQNFYREVTEEMYIIAIRSHIKRRTLLIKREPKDICINPFNSQILSLFRSNMDLQYIIDPYGCVHYIVNYISKSFRGVSKLVRNTIKEVSNGYDDPLKRLRTIGQKFLNGSEVSAQEAVYIILSIPLTMCSRQTIFINTGEKELRTKILKSQSKLQKLTKDSTDIFSIGLLEYYIGRSVELEGMCLADFAAKYQKKVSKDVEPEMDESEGEEEEIEFVDKSRIKVTNDKKKTFCFYERKNPKIIRYRRYQLTKDPMNYFREKLMLYIPWRDEDRDILNKDIEKLFKDNLNQIKAAESRYIKDNTIDYDSIATNMEERGSYDPEGLEENEYDIVNEYRIHDTQRPESSLNIDIPSVNRSSDTSNKFISFRTPTFQTSDEYFSLIRTLNDGQRRYLYGLMNMVETNNTPVFHLITGSAGCGKSVLIKAIHQTLIRYYAKDPTYAKVEELTVLLCAPTGLAAFNINGNTLHTALGLTVSENQEKDSIHQLDGDRLNQYRNKLINLKFILADEVSMIGARMLRKIDNRLKQIMGTDSQMFGGVSILFFGDFNQLPPVKDVQIFKTPGSINPNKMDLTMLAGNILWKPFKIYRLTEIMRQKEDLQFAKALNNLANFEMTEEDKALFKDRIFSTEHIRPERRFDELPKSCVHLFATNCEVDNHNGIIIARSIESPIESNAEDCASARLPEHIRKNLCDQLLIVDRSQTHGLMTNLVLKVGIRYMVIVNIDTNDGLVNGTSGVLRKVIMSSDGKTPFSLWIDFENPIIGPIQREKYSCSNQLLTPIFKVRKDILRRYGGRNYPVSRTQFPVVPSEAITIHKSQGQTYSEVVIHLDSEIEPKNNRKTTNNMTINSYYTALSRAKNSSGLYLIGEFKPSEMPTPANLSVINEINRLKQECPVVFDNFFEKTEEKTSIFYQNYPYLNHHFRDIICDKYITNSDFLVFVETKSNDTRIDGYKLLHQLEYNATKHQSRPFGISIYGKENIESTLITKDCLLSRKGDSHFEVVVCQYKETRIIVIYSSPGYEKKDTIDNVLEFIRTKKFVPSIIIGDFNININSNKGDELERRLLLENFTLKVPKNINSTPDAQIDLVFANFEVDARYYQTYTTTHRPINAFF